MLYVLLTIRRKVINGIYMECVNPIFAFDTGLKTAKGNMAYYLDLERKTENNEMFIGSRPPCKYERRPPYIRVDEFGNEYFTKFVKVPCGKCPACQINKASEWSTRLYFESLSNMSYYFTTLTYNDVYYSPNRDFKRDIQLFLKSFRALVKDVRVRYFYSFEYGDHTERGHFHLILFFDRLFQDKLGLVKVKDDHNYYTSELVQRAWKFKGYDITVPSDDSIAAFNYVSRYCCKKAGNDEGFIGMSRRPGLGSVWCKNAGVSFDDTQIMIHSQGHTLWKKYPKYFQKILEEVNPDLYERLQDSIKHYIYACYDKPFEGQFDYITSKSEREKAAMLNVFAKSANSFKKKL